MKKGNILLVIFAIIFITAIVPSLAFDYPPARKGDVVDDFYGTKVADCYRWMEDPESEETINWVNAQNVVTADFVNTPIREKIEKRYTKLFNYPKYSLPHKEGDFYLFKKNDGLQAQYVMYKQDELGGESDVILDPNKLSDDGTISLARYSFTKDGSLMGYGLSEKGSDWQTIHIRNIETGEDLGDIIKFTRFVTPAWKDDKSGFYYDCYPDPSTVPAGEETYNNKLYWHTLGDDQSEDKLIYERPDDNRLGFGTTVTEDGQYLVIYVWRGTNRENGIYYLEMNGEDKVIRLLDDFDAGYSFIDNDGAKFYFKTDLDAENGRIIAIDISNPAKENWEEIIPESKDVLSWAKIINNQFVLAYMHDAHDLLKIYNLDSSFDREIELPTIGSIYGISGKREDTEMFFSFASFIYPKNSFRYDFKTGETSVYRSSEVDFDPAGYETKQIFFNSKDGTRIPLFITHKKDLVLDGTNPTILYGYGGFQSCQTPYFSLSKAMWLENGGVFVLAVTRGGIEYGEQWHQASMREGRQRVYEDFIGAAEWLIENKYTNNKRIAIEGGSGGGLLVASCMVQRPELFGAVLCEVPLTDMLRFHKLGVGRWWVGEYGNADDSLVDFEFLYAYSPYHNIHQGTVYPPTLITTADTDDRVVPSHAKKFAAELQSKDGGENPILIRIETKAGHGGGKPTKKIIEEVSDIYSFLFKVFEMDFNE